MSDQHRDSELRGRFDELRRLDASRAPSFADVMERAQAGATRDAGSTARYASRVTLRRFGWTAGLAVAAAIAAVIVIPRASSNEDAFEQAVQSFQSDPALGAWRSPTDGLLNLPGSRLLSTVPSLGAGQQ
ncbi:MAG: hypothetical protein WEE89_22535 [Gemmatimonadota bacterium]